MRTSLPPQRSFGDWLRQRRRALDFSREKLARQVGCSTVTLRKLESEERHPSPQMAERLAEVLQIVLDDRPAFLQFARGNPFAAPVDVLGAPAAEPYRAPHHNLPLQLTSFIGREQELADIARLLPAARLLTLSGPGGSGKTRLALQTSAAQLAHYPDGVWWVELAPLADPALLPQTIAAFLGLQETPGRLLTELLAEHLRPRQVLLLLDNCEHLIAACAEMAEYLLRICPGLTILATSRESLAIAGERVYFVPTLSLPDPMASVPLEAVSKSESARLFCERAQTVAPALTPTPGNAAAIAAICRQLDGIPLAIELAAARLQLLNLDQIVARLDDCFGLLTNGSRTALPRHQTLQALMDWSYELLSASERSLLRRLAVFAGGWNLEAAEVVCADDGLPPGGVLDLLTHLVNKSLVVVVRPPDSETRYDMLETIRQYARAKLAASGEADSLRRRHALYFCSLARRLNAILDTADQRRALDQFEGELGNFRAALPWIQIDTDLDLGPSLADMLWRFLYIRGYWAEAQTWLETALTITNAAALDQTRARARALAGLGTMLQFQGAYAAGERYLNQSLRIAQNTGDRFWQAMSLRMLGRGRCALADAGAAQAQLEESVAIFAELGDRHWQVTALNHLAAVAVMQEDIQRGTQLLREAQALNQELGGIEISAWSLHYLGHIAQLQEDYPRAIQLHRDSLSLFRRLSLQLGIAWVEHALGELALAMGDSRGALQHLGGSLHLFRQLSDRAGLAWCLAGLAAVAVLDEEPQRAAGLWAAAEALRRSLGARPAPASRVTRECLMSVARQQSGAEVFATAWTAGQSLSPQQAIELALPTRIAG